MQLFASPAFQKRNLLQARRMFMAAVQPASPLLAQLVVTRRCNLTCGYCNEYDDFSPPVPTEELIARVDHLADLGTVVLTLTGGEPLLHPEVDKVVARARSHGMFCTSITNAYLITKKWIERLNAADLGLVQVSVDNLVPTEMSRKSWRNIKKKLFLLREHAKFSVNVNAVLGSCTPEETRKLVSEIRELGFYMTVGLRHDALGQVDPGLIGDALPQFYDEMRAACNKNVFFRAGEGWETRMLRDGKSPWRCRAGGRYLYVDEFGIVSYCSQRRGDPGIPLLEYTREDLRREFYVTKGCEDSCTIACVRRASSLDGWRRQSPSVPPPGRSTSSRVRLPVVEGRP